MQAKPVKQAYFGTSTTGRRLQQGPPGTVPEIDSVSDAEPDAAMSPMSALGETPSVLCRTRKKCQAAIESRHPDRCLLEAVMSQTRSLALPCLPCLLPLSTWHLSAAWKLVCSRQRVGVQACEGAYCFQCGCGHVLTRKFSCFRWHGRPPVPGAAPSRAPAPAAQACPSPARDAC